MRKVDLIYLRDTLKKYGSKLESSTKKNAHNGNTCLQIKKYILK